MKIKMVMTADDGAILADTELRSIEDALMCIAEFEEVNSGSQDWIKGSGTDNLRKIARKRGEFLDKYRRTPGW